MAIPKVVKAGVKERQEQNPVVSQPPEYVSATVDSSQVRFDQLTQYVSGRSWTCDYLSRILGSHDDIRSYESDSHPVFQQYMRIKGFELKVTQALTPSQNAETKDMSLRGGANVYGVFVPKEGDIFLADVGDGQEGLFNVTSSNRLTHRMSSVYEIEYVLIRYVDEAVRKDLQAKTQQTKVFHKDFLETGEFPLLEEAKSELVKDMGVHYERLLQTYFHDFYSRDLRTLLVPNQREITYDPFVVRFLKTILSTDDHPILRNVSEFNVMGDQTMYEFTLWSCLESMDYTLLSMAIHNAGLVDVKRFFNGRPTLNSIYYTGVKRVVYPDMAPTHVDAGYRPRVDYDLEKVVRGAARFRELDRLMTDTLVLDPTLEVYEALEQNRQPQIRRVTYDDGYVLSMDFYRHDGSKPLCKLEALTLDALKGKAINLEVLAELCTGSLKWDNVERFYYTPILLTLIRTYRRRFV